MSQFGTFDNSADRKELQVLFQKLGEDLPEAEANVARAKWLRKLIDYPLYIDPAQCHPVGAYCLFVQITGVLNVKITDAAISLSKYVAKRGWHDT